MSLSYSNLAENKYLSKSLYPQFVCKLRHYSWRMQEYFNISVGEHC